MGGAASKVGKKKKKPQPIGPYGGYVTQLQKTNKELQRRRQEEVKNNNNKLAGIAEEKGVVNGPTKQPQQSPEPGQKQTKKEYKAALAQQEQARRQKIVQAHLQRKKTEKEHLERVLSTVNTPQLSPAPSNLSQCNSGLPTYGSTLSPGPQLEASPSGMGDGRDKSAMRQDAFDKIMGAAKDPRLSPRHMSPARLRPGQRDASPQPGSPKGYWPGTEQLAADQAAGRPINRFQSPEPQRDRGYTPPRQHQPTSSMEVQRNYRQSHGQGYMPATPFGESAPLPPPAKPAPANPQFTRPSADPPRNRNQNAVPNTADLPTLGKTPQGMETRYRSPDPIRNKKVDAAQPQHSPVPQRPTQVVPPGAGAVQRANATPTRPPPNQNQPIGRRMLSFDPTRDNTGPGQDFTNFAPRHLSPAPAAPRQRTPSPMNQRPIPVAPPAQTPTAAPTAVQASPRWSVQHSQASSPERRETPRSPFDSDHEDEDGLAEVVPVNKPAPPRANGRANGYAKVEAQHNYDKPRQPAAIQVKPQNGGSHPGSRSGSRPGSRPRQQPSTPDIEEVKPADSGAARKSNDGGVLNARRINPAPNPLPSIASRLEGADKYREVGILGEGRTGMTKLMKNLITQELVAAKWVEHNSGEALSKETEREIVNHRRLRHPHIIGFHEVFTTDEYLVIVMEHASGGQLDAWIEGNGRFSESKARHILLQIVDAVAFCHKRGIIHRNLRADNIFLTGSIFEPSAKISGFGYSKDTAMDSIAVTTVALPAYQPPEILQATRNEMQDSMSASASDCWAIGVILFYMLAGEMPFRDADGPGILDMRLMRNIVNATYKFPPDVELSPECLNFIKRVLVKDQKSRMSAEEMKRHPWLAGKLLQPSELVRESSQSEIDITTVIERARQRRLGRANVHSHMG